MPAEEVADQVDHAAGMLGVGRDAGQRAQPGQGEGGDGVGRWGRPVEHVLGPHDELSRRRMPVVKKPPPSTSANRSRRASAVSAARSVQHGLAGQLGQSGEAVDQPGVVGGVGQVPRPPVALPAPEPATVRVHRRWSTEELADPHGGGGPGGGAGGGGGLGQGRGVHGVPLGEDLVVEAGSHPLRPGRQRGAAPARPPPARARRQQSTDRPAQDGGALEVARAVGRTSRIRPRPPRRAGAVSPGCPTASADLVGRHT